MLTDKNLYHIVTLAPGSHVKPGFQCCNNHIRPSLGPWQPVTRHSPALQPTVLLQLCGPFDFCWYLTLTLINVTLSRAPASRVRHTRAVRNALRNARSQRRSSGRAARGTMGIVVPARGAGPPRSARAAWKPRGGRRAPRPGRAEPEEPRLPQRGPGDPGPGLLVPPLSLSRRILATLPGQRRPATREAAPSRDAWRHPRELLAAQRPVCELSWADGPRANTGSGDPGHKALGFGWLRSFPPTLRHHGDPGPAAVHQGGCRALAREEVQRADGGCGHLLLAAQRRLCLCWEAGPRRAHGPVSHVWASTLLQTKVLLTWCVLN